jgi:hypothetical protein
MKSSLLVVENFKDVGGCIFRILESRHTNNEGIRSHIIASPDAARAAGTISTRDRPIILS